MSEYSQNLRKKILLQRDKLSSKELFQKSSKITTFLSQIQDIRQASVLFIYVHFRSEVQTLSFIQQCLREGKRVTVPVTKVAEKHLEVVEITNPQTDLLPGYCGIPEPVTLLQENRKRDPTTIDVAIIPGSVFDRKGGRLGYGGGYYDRFLSQQAPQARRIALSFSLQLVDTLVLQPHDQVMDMVVTEEKRYSCRRE